MTDEVQEVLSGSKRWACVQSDCVAFLDSLPEASVDLVMCSPPYERARLYLEDGSDLNIARDTEEWVVWMVTVCEAARRACKGLCAFVVEGQTKDYRYSCSPMLLIADLHRKGFRLFGFGCGNIIRQRAGVVIEGEVEGVVNDQ